MREDAQAHPREAVRTVVAKSTVILVGIDLLEAQRAAAPLALAQREL